ncbi:MAG: phosphoribosyl 1,2-cyclic phosphate phosphodiesterase PhnP [Bacteroidetes bacterium HLUCCA01]|nr:MAG: phosphoribosyl 1,2-cyclic phosphate phosphodiesterase PhnP [Bacteroidetes bacterium HLUCCA01]
MKLTFLGTGTSMGVPVAGGFGNEHPSGDARDIRWRTSAWVQTDETSILIDAGPEFRLQSLRSGMRRIDLLLITHEHTDHIAGLDDLRPFNYVQKQTIPVVTTPSCRSSIIRRFEYMFGPDKTPGSVNIDIKTSSQPFQFNDCTITPLPVMHGTLEVYGYRINNLSYVTDANYISDETLSLIKGSSVLVLNALRWEPDHPTHFTVPQAVALAERIGIPEVYFVHMNSEVRHAAIQEKLPPHIKLAFDQQVVNIP